MLSILMIAAIAVFAVSVAAGTESKDCASVSSKGLLQRKTQTTVMSESGTAAALQHLEQMMVADHEALQKQLAVDQQEMESMRQEIAHLQQTQAFSDQDHRFNSAHAVEHQKHGKKTSALASHAANSRTFELCPSNNKAPSALLNSAREVQNMSAAPDWLGCAESEVMLFQPVEGTARFSTQCCPADALFCSGCAEMDAAKTACTKCQGGFSKNAAGICEACIDHPGWKDSQGQTCHTATCSNDKNQGFSSNEACCKCNGGQRAATQFIYHVGSMSLGDTAVSGFPVPRTAEKYAVDKNCALGKHGLTIDATTGKLMLQRECTSVGCGSPEPFSITCEVTAYQGVGLTASAKMTMQIGHVTFGDGISPVVLKPGGSISPSKATEGITFSNFQCAPNAFGWLTLEETTGRLFLGKPLICNTFDCGPKHILKANAKGIVGSSIPKCCDPVCSAYKCPAHFLPILAAATTAGNSTSVCCEPVCSGFSCPRHFILLPGNEEIRKNSAAECCEPLCSGFSCPAHQILLPGYESIRANSSDKCCEPLCSGFPCAKDTLLRPENATLRANTQEECCEAACSGFTCPEDFLPVLQAEKVHGNTQPVCCVDACSTFTCKDIYVLKPEPSKIRGKSQAPCCEKAGDPGLFANVYKFSSWEAFPHKWQDCTMPDDLSGYTITENKTYDKLRWWNWEGSGVQQKYFSLNIEGYLRVATPGTYKFSVQSDDGAKMWVNGEVLFSNMWCRSSAYGRRRRRRDSQEKQGEVELAKGIVPIRITYFQKSSDCQLVFMYTGPDTGDEWQDVESLFHRTASTDLTAPPDEVDLALKTSALLEQESSEEARPDGQVSSEANFYEAEAEAQEAAVQVSPSAFLEDTQGAAEADQLSAEPSTDSVPGSITGEEGMEETRGGVCSVKTSTGATISMVVLAPLPWNSFAYEHASLYASLGETAPVTKAKGAGGLAPSRFSASCPGANFVFDILTGVATWEGYRIFSMDVKDGSLRLEPEKDLAASLDQLADTASRRKLSLSCAIFGHYEWPPAGHGPVLTTSVSIEIRDDTCWAKKTLNFAARSHKHAGSAEKCRSLCRASKTCSHYGFSSACYFYSGLCSSPGDSACHHKQIEAMERYPDCGERHSCIEISLPGLAYMSGGYCPMGEHAHGTAAGPVYFKQGLTVQESFWLQGYDSTSKGADFCHDGDWLIRKPEKDLDFDNSTSDYMELHGDPVVCIGSTGSASADLISQIFDSNQVSLSVRGRQGVSSAFARVEVPSCGAPNITAQNVEQGEEPSTVDVIQLDDPSTSTQLDHWLHPCDCAPHAWGSNTPVASDTVSAIPAGSNNKFEPGTFRISVGQFVCEQEFILETIIESEDETLDEGTCKSRCLGRANCAYFWDGEVASSKQCRLYRDCKMLVREVGISGALTAQIRKPVCHVAEPELCWKTTKRRSFLGAGADSWGCLHRDLIEQCDQKLMLGGLGVEACARCTYADWSASADWTKKTRVPTSARSGHGFDVTCWDERYKYYASPKETLTCLAGSWLNSQGEAGLSGFSCASCVQIVDQRYKDFDAQDRQELFFSSAMKVQLFVDSRTRLAMKVTGQLQTGTADTFAAEITTMGSETNRRWRSVDSTDKCLEQTGEKTVAVRQCSSSDKQLLDPLELSSLLWTDFKTKVQVQSAHSEGLRPNGNGKGPVTLRNFFGTLECGEHVVSGLGFRHQKELGLGGTCTAASTFGSIFQGGWQKFQFESGDKIVNEKHGTCMVLKNNLPNLIRSVSRNQCLVSPTSDGTAVTLAGCNAGDKKQLWMEDGNRYKNVQTGRCLDWAHYDGNSRVVAHSCHSGTNQQFEYDVDRYYVKDKKYKTCLQVNVRYTKKSTGCAGPEKWNVGGAQGKGVAACAAAVMADGQCEKDFFTYVERGDKNCGCKTHGPLSLRTANCSGADYYQMQPSTAQHVKCSTTTNSAQQWKIEKQSSGGVMSPEHFDCSGAADSQIAIEVHSSSMDLVTSASTRINNVFYDEESRELRVLPGGIANKGDSAKARVCISANDAGKLEEANCDKEKSEQKWIVGNALKRWTDIDVKCPAGTLISKFWKETGAVGWNCAKVASLGACAPGQTPQVDTIGELRTRETLKDFGIACDTSHGLQSFKAEASDKGEWLRFRFMCCQIVQVPMTILPVAGFMAGFADPWQGMYCPASMGVDGRLSYEQTRSFGGSASNSRRLYHDEKSGEWCVTGMDCTASSIVSPLDDQLGTSRWNVVPVSDFDAIFEAKGAKVIGAKKGKKPPELIKFGAPEPSYAPECQDESHPGSPTFDIEKMNKEAEGLDAENPCNAVYGKAPTERSDGVEIETNGDGANWWADDMKGGGKGEAGVTYTAALACEDRQGSRDWLAAKLGFAHDFVSGLLGYASTTVDTVGAFMPDAAAEPLGVGVTMEPGDVFSTVGQQILATVQGVADFSKWMADLHIEQANTGDCNTPQLGFARTFCDLHCIRDAVRKGDEAILKGLEGAVDVIGQNTNLLLDYYVGAPAEEGDASLLERQEAVEGLRSSLAEAKSMASQAALDTGASLAVQRAVQGFSTKWQAPAAMEALEQSVHSPSRSSNVTTITAMTRDMHKVRSMLATASSSRLSKAEEIRVNTVQYASQMNRRLKAKTQILGMYKQGAQRVRLYQRWLSGKFQGGESADVMAELKEESVQNTLRSMDAVWWQLRAAFDGYLNAAQQQVDMMQSALDLLQGYTSECSASFSSLKAGYSASMQADRKAHDKLREVWEVAVPKVGELASMVVDGDVMDHLAAADVESLEAKPGSCHALEEEVKRALEQGLWGQTQRQLHVVFLEMAMLQHRFVDAHLGQPPDIASVEEARRRSGEAVESSLAAVPRLAEVLAGKHGGCL